MESYLPLFHSAAWISVLVGLGLLLAPQRLRNLYTASPLATLDTPVKVERYIYRHHKPFGLAIAVGGALAGVVLISLLLRGELATGPMVAFAALLVANLLAIAVALVIYLRPSLLKGPEATFNRWIPAPAGAGDMGGDTGEVSLRWLGAALIVAGALLIRILRDYFS